MGTCWTPRSRNQSRQWGEAALSRFSGSCHPLCTVLIFIPADRLVVLHKHYNNAGMLPGWPLHACSTHGDVAGSQAVTQFRGHTQQADTWRVALGVRTHVDVGLHKPAKVVQCVEGSQQLWRGDSWSWKGSAIKCNADKMTELHKVAISPSHLDYY